MLPHTLITASAGSGKTWSLTVRYIRLLMLGALPESIVALTFSRKAAGEFFNAILHRLAEAASDPAKAAALAQDIAQPSTSQTEFCQALLAMTSRLPFLMLGTLDSFFIRMARSFPFELGLSGDFTLLDPHQQAVEKMRVYEQVFAPDSSNPRQRRDFMQAFTEATHGKDELRVRNKLDQFVKEWHGLFLSAPHPAQWGQHDAIWPSGGPLPLTREARAAQAERLRGGLQSANLTDKQWDRWNPFLADAVAHLPGSAFTKPLDFIFAKALAAKEDLRRGRADLTVERKRHPVEGPAAEALLLLCDSLLAGEFESALRQTRGIFDVISRYDQTYHQLVRRQGRLTFQDVQMILAAGLSPDSLSPTTAPEAALTHADHRQLMDYRLDARYDHWLLDEFQDTSRVQWRVLANLIDEAVQDSEGRKSFFAVGDQKQSIYEWRGGTPRLFDEIREQYNAAASCPEDQPIKVQPLSVSQRSGPAVIAMVNDLLGDRSTLEAVFPPDAVAQWPWQAHSSRNLSYGGLAQVVEVADEDAEAPEDIESDPDDEEPIPQADARWRAAAQLLLQLRPLERGLSCALLCHRNPRALAIADFLRSATDMEVVCESDLSIARDNPATSALLALIQAAAHPLDTFAWQQVLMTPISNVIASQFPAATPSALRHLTLLKVLSQVAASGFHDTLRWWIEALPPLDPFSQSRLDELCACARQFDATGSHDADEFLAFAHAWTVRGTSHAAAIQVMTVHRSKGLTFDIVLIPDLHDQMFRAVYPVGLQTNEFGAVQWLLKMPKRDLALADSVLAAALRRAEAASWRERMAGLYVMVTRAKYANYIFTKPGPKKPSSSFSLARAVRSILTNAQDRDVAIAQRTYPLLAEYGDPAWIEAHPLKPAAPAAATPALPSPAPPRLVPPSRGPGIPLPARRASGSLEDEPGGLLFQSARQAAREVGLAIHEAFRRVRWADDAPSALAAPDLDPQAAEAARACIADPSLAPLFAPPEGPAEVWRERAFDLVLNGTLISGVFDRVVIQRTSTGQASRALLLDFKTEVPRPSAAAAARAHRPQLETYRQALSHLLALPQAHIRTVLLFTSTQETVDL